MQEKAIDRVSVSPEIRAARYVRQNCIIPRLRTIREFAEQEVIIPNGIHEGLRYKSYRQPYSGLMLDAFSGPWRRRVVTAPSQSGKTLSAFVIPLLYHLFEVQETVVCGVPTLEMARDKWEQDILPVLERTRYCSLMPSKGRGAKGGMAAGMTFLNGATLRFMGAQGGSRGDKQRAGFTSRVVVITETDGLDTASKTSRESSPLRQLEARTMSYGDRAVVYMESTVSTKDGATWREYSSGTASRIFVPCVKCGVWVSPERCDLHGWDQADSQQEAGRKAFFACPSCGEKWTEIERQQMNRDGRLVHRGQEILPCGSIVGSLPDTLTLGFRANAFNNLFLPTSMLGEESWISENGGQDFHSEDGRALRQFFWAEPVVDDTIEVDAVTIGIVRGTERGYSGRVSGIERGKIPDECECVTIGIDVNKRFLTWESCGWQGSICHVIDYGQFSNEQVEVLPEELAIARGLDDLKSEVEKRWKIDVGLVDSGHWSTTIYRVVNNWGMPWMCCEGIPSYVHPSFSDRIKRPGPAGTQWYWHSIDKVVRHNSSYIKHQVMSRLMVQPLDKDGNRRGGSLVMFGSDPREHTEFSKQICSEEWVRQWKDGKGYTEEWVKRHRENHYLDTQVMNLLAFSIRESLRRRVK